MRAVTVSEYGATRWSARYPLRSRSSSRCSSATCEPSCGRPPLRVACRGDDASHA
jgi:hypothetical protein